MKIKKIYYKTNLETAKMYYIKEGGLFNFFKKENLSIIYIWAKINNKLHWS